MNRFVHHLLISIMAGLLIVLGIEVIIRIKPSQNIYTIKLHHLRSRATGIKTLLLGHSLFEEGFNSNILDSTYNFASCGRVSLYDVELLQHYVDSLPNLKNVLYPIHYALDNPSGFNQSVGEREAYVYNYYKYMGIPTPNSMYLYYLPKITFQWEEKNLGYMEDVTNIDSTGYGRFPESEPFIHRVAPQYFSQKNSDSFCKNLLKLAKICHERNIRFIAVTPPAANIYVFDIPQEGMDRLDSIVNTVQSKYPIEYFNYLTDSMFRDDKYYHDPTHLNHQGATLFAQRVKNDFGL